MRGLVVVLVMCLGGACGSPGAFEECDDNQCADGLVCKPNASAGQPDLCKKTCTSDADCPKSSGSCSVPTVCKVGVCELGDQRCL